MTRRGLLVTGTDTEVGKTVVTASIVAALREAEVPLRALKPVESGLEDNGGVPADAALLARCAGQSIESTYVYALREPLAPAVAAERDSVALDQSRIDAVVADVDSSDFLVVEGVGGALVEVTRGTAVADLGARWGLPVLVVAANRLGVLNHTLLTVEALRARKAQVLGVVLNTVSEAPPTVSEQTNAEELARLLPADVPLLGTFPFVPAPDREAPESLALRARATLPDLLLAWTQ
ncbi:MAG: dethiobiotin synthase [Deltaproteobacteria bacterium]|nr:dethiobiotin synthase [Deltaproteobacteria bacterium]